MATNRPLPPTIPPNILLTLILGEHNGKKQWVGYYQPAESRHSRDLMKVVVHCPRRCLPFSGQRWLVRPLYLAPKADIVFANVVKPMEGM
jgi:hypothetical protein